MKKYFTFDDVLIVPKFSTIRSREDCKTTTKIGNKVTSAIELQVPVISANMDTVTEEQMSTVMSMNGAMGALHRFCSIDRNIEMYKKNTNCFVSFGANDNEVERAVYLYNAGALNFILDVAHGASINSLRAYNEFRTRVKDPKVHVMVGNFATVESIREFNKFTTVLPDSYKVGIGGGSMCTTRIVTGVGIPTLSSVMECAQAGYEVIADGGIRTSGDVAKCLAAGAKAVMIGGMLSGTNETPGTIEHLYDVPHKIYRGSASKESYEVQNKVAKHRTPEGVSTFVKIKGSAADVISDIRAGVISCMSYVSAYDLHEFRRNAQFIEITQNAMAESHAHGKQA